MGKKKKIIVKKIKMIKKIQILIIQIKKLILIKKIKNFQKEVHLILIRYQNNLKHLKI